MNASLNRALFKFATESPSKIWLHGESQNVSIASGLDAIVGISEFLENISPDKSVPIEVEGDGEIAHVLLIVAILCSGRIYLPRNRTLVRSGKTIDSIGCRASRVSVELDPGTGERGIVIDNVLLDFPDCNPSQVLDLTDSSEQPAAYYFTSGTTGDPKVIVTSNSNLFRGGQYVSEALGLTGDDIIAATLTFDFDYGLNQIYCSIFIRCGLSLGFYSSMTTSWFDQVQKTQATILPTMPFLAESYFRPVHLSNKTNFSVRLVTSSGGPFSELHRKLAKGVFPNSGISTMYGLSEGFRATILPADMYELKPNSVGLPIGDTLISIRDEAGNIKNRGEIGEIYQSSGCLTWGYLNDPKSTAERFCDDDSFPGRRWLRSGDIGWLDNEGFLYVSGRASSQIKRFGIRVSLDEVENAFKSIKGVQSAVAIAVERNSTESDVALVLVAPGLDEKKIMEAQRKLAPELRAQKIILIEEMEGNFNGGKPNRTEIAKKYL